MAVYRLTRYPRQLELVDGTAVTLRPMTASDCPALLAFFRQVPEADRFFLKDDVLSEAVVLSWGAHLNYDRALPLLAFVGDRVVADAVLVRHRGGYRRHLAEVRLTVAPEFRASDLSSVLVRELVDIAWDAELEFVEFELVKDAQDDQVAIAESLGAAEAGTIVDAVKDSRGDPHSLVFLRIPLGKSWEWTQMMNQPAGATR